MSSQALTPVLTGFAGLALTGLLWLAYRRLRAWFRSIWQGERWG